MRSTSKKSTLPKEFSDVAISAKSIAIENNLFLAPSALLDFESAMPAGFIPPDYIDISSNKSKGWNLALNWIIGGSEISMFFSGRGTYSVYAKDIKRNHCFLSVRNKRVSTGFPSNIYRLLVKPSAFIA